MELQITGYLLKGSSLTKKRIEVSQDKYIKIKKKLISVHSEIISLIKEYKKQGKIKSIYFPRAHKDKEFQNHLDELVLAKRDIKKSIRKINTLFLR